MSNPTCVNPQEVPIIQKQISSILEEKSTPNTNVTTPSDNTILSTERKHSQPNITSSSDEYDYTLLYSCLQEGNITEVEAQLKMFDVYALAPLDSMVILDSCLASLSTGKNKGNLEILEMVMNEWLPPEDPDIDFFVGQMAALISINISNLAYVMDMYGDIAPEEILKLDLESPLEERLFSFPMVATRIEEAGKQCSEPSFMALRQDAWRRLLDCATEHKKELAIRFINAKLANWDSPTAPKYMRDKVPQVRSNNLDPKYTEQQAKNIINKLLSEDTKSSSMYDTVNKAMTELTTQELGSIVSHFDTTSNMEADFDVIEGPENPREIKGIIQTCNGALSIRKSKSCRMLTCNCIQESPDDDNWELKKLNWFKHKCDACSKKILKAAHAIRLPLDRGGWIGCYCSQHCAITDANKDISNYFTGNSDSMERYRKTNKLFAVILHKGILEQEDSVLAEESKSNFNLDSEIAKPTLVDAIYTHNGLLSTSQSCCEHTHQKHDQDEKKLEKENIEEEEEEVLEMSDVDAVDLEADQAEQNTLDDNDLDIDAALREEALFREQESLEQDNNLSPLPEETISEEEEGDSSEHEEETISEEEGDTSEHEEETISEEEEGDSSEHEEETISEEEEEEGDSSEEEEKWNTRHAITVRQNRCNSRNEEVKSLFNEIEKEIHDSNPYYIRVPNSSIVQEMIMGKLNEKYTTTIIKRTCNHRCNGDCAFDTSRVSNYDENDIVDIVKAAYCGHIHNSKSCDYGLWIEVKMNSDNIQ